MLGNKSNGSGTGIVYKIENKKIDNIVNKQESQVEIKELKLKLHKKVTWTEDTIDNEHMNKKKSKS
jgi:hypothetical protein